MKLALFVSLAALSLSIAACSKHECDLKNDAEKKEFGALADMTEGAFSCDVEGNGLGEALVGTNKCDIGSANCVSTMNSIHAAPATVKDVAARNKAFLEKGGYKLEEKTVQSKFSNGKDIEGTVLSGKNGDKDITVKVFPFGTDMVETRTYLAAIQ